MDITLQLLRIGISEIRSRAYHRANVRRISRGQIYLHRMRRTRIFLKRKTLRGLREKKIVKLYRLPSAVILDIYLSIQHEIEPRTSRSMAISGLTKLFSTLHFLASGSFQCTVAEMGGLSQPSFSRIFDQVLKAILKRYINKISFPSTVSGWKALREGFTNIAGFPNVVGAIDGTHVAFAPPHELEEVCRNRKSFHSINIQATCDWQLKFLNIFASFPGATHDAYIIRHSNIYQAFETGDISSGWLLGDSGYGCKPWLMIPLRKPRSQAQKNYNRAHILTRVVVERSFGVLKSRFRCLSKSAGELQYSAGKLCKIFLVCCILHNICIDYEIENGLIFRKPRDRQNHNPAFVPLQHSSGYRVRQHLIENYFSSI